jgi:hypothetical protein
MSAIDEVSSFCTDLARHRIRYEIDIVRDGSIMVTLAVPGERWEFEFHDDGTAEIERFVTSGVEPCADPLAVVLEQYE